VLDYHEFERQVVDSRIGLANIKNTARTHAGNKSRRRLFIYRVDYSKGEFDGLRLHRPARQARPTSHLGGGGVLMGAAASHGAHDRLVCRGGGQGLRRDRTDGLAMRWR
jgi:hypothetical protein